MFSKLPRACLAAWMGTASPQTLRRRLIYPLLPFFLTRVLSAGAVSLGVIEGAAEATSSLLKIWAGPSG